VIFTTTGDSNDLVESAADDYGTAEERQKAHARDEKLDWRKLVDNPDLADTTRMGGLSFYDAAGLRFHLPAYLSLAVKKPDEYVIGDLLIVLSTPLDDYNQSRLAGLTAPQKACIGRVLRYLHEYYGEPTHPQIQWATENYWNQK
jgi:hypothetical protein